MDACDDAAPGGAMCTQSCRPAGGCPPGLGCFPLADAGSTRCDADPRASLRPLAIAFSAVLLLVNIPLSFMGSLYSWVVTLVAFIVLWLPVYTGLFEDKS